MSRRSFVALRKSPHRGRSGPIQVSFVSLEEDDEVQVAFAISKKCGGAVQRNLIRRRLRGAASEILVGHPTGAYLVRTEPAARDCSYSELFRNLEESLEKVSRKSKEVTA